MFIIIKMDRFINEEIENLINGLPLGAKSAQRSGTFEKQDFSMEMSNINKTYNSTLNNIQYFKILTILSLKQVTWNRELRDVFNISKSSVEKYLYYLELNGFILNKQFVELDDVLYETILRTNPKELYNHITKTHLITLTPEGKEFAKRVINDAVKIHSRTDFLTSLTDLNKKIKSFKDVYNYLLKLEGKINYSNNGIKIIEGYRYIKYPDGTLIMKKTESKKQLDREIKLNILKNKSNNNSLIIIDKNKDLIELERNELKILDELIQKDNNIKYRGVYSYLNSIELDNIIDGVSKKELKESEKLYKEYIKNRLKDQNKNEDMYNINKILNREPFIYEEEKRHERECLNLLNSLV